MVKKFGIVNRYDSSKEFPVIILRRTAIKSCMDELLWICQKKFNNIHDLNSSIWGEWADASSAKILAELVQRFVNNYTNNTEYFLGST